MPENTPKLSIILMHHRTVDFLKLCLDSIRRTIKDVDYEVIVVDSAAQRESRDIANDRGQKFPRFKYSGHKENLGYSKGVNTGIDLAEGEYILILNPDIIASSDSISTMLSYMKKHPDIGLLGPRMLHFNDEHQQTYFRFYTPATIIARRTPLGKIKPLKRAAENFLMQDTNPNQIQTPDWLMGSALMTRRTALEKVGNMDERFFMYFEDVDWARRFWHNGYKVVYYPKATLYHYHQRQSKSRFGILDTITNRKTRWHIASAIKFFLKYRSLETFKGDSK